MLLFIWLIIHLCGHVRGAVCWGDCVGGLCGELCGGSWFLLVDPTPSSWAEAWPAVDRRRDQTCPTEQRYTNSQLVRPLLVTTLSYYSVLYRAPVCAHLYAHIHQGFLPKPARSSCGLCCCSSLARSFVRPLLLTSVCMCVKPIVVTSVCPFPVTSYSVHAVRPPTARCVHLFPCDPLQLCTTTHT